jgi:hypothetical protein
MTSTKKPASTPSVLPAYPDLLGGISELLRVARTDFIFPYQDQVISQTAPGLLCL